MNLINYETPAKSYAHDYWLLNQSHFRRMNQLPNNEVIRVDPSPEISHKGVHPLRHSLGRRILAGFLVMAFFSLIVALAAILYTSQTGIKSGIQVERDQQVTSLVLRLELAVERQFNAVRGSLLEEIPLENTGKEALDSSSDYQQAIEKLYGIFDSLKIDRESFNEVQNLYGNFTETIAQIRTIELATLNKTEILTYEKKAREQKQALISAIDKNLKIYKEVIDAQIQSARSEGVLVTFLALFLVLGTTAGGVVVASIITRSITKPLRELASVADSIRKDDLNIEMPHPRGNDEVASLAGAMLSMTENLRISREKLQGSLNETRRRNRELVAINRVIASISGSLKLGQILEVSLDEMLAVSEMESGCLFLMEPDKQQLLLAISRNQSEEYKEKINRIQVGEQLTGNVAKTGEVIVKNNVETDNKTQTDPVFFQNKRSFLGIPLVSSGNIVGVLNLTSSRNIHFLEADLVLYKAIGSQVGIAVENAQLYAQAQQLAILEERNRLARDLHDSVTQTLFSITLTAESARAMLVKKPEKVATQLELLQSLGRSALAEMRALIFQLRPAALEEQGLVQALEKHFDSFKGKENFEIEFSKEGDRRLSKEQEQALYWITQESVNNIVKHAQASKVKVELVINEGTASLKIRDNGIGFMPETVLAKSNVDQRSLGLTSMKERAELVGGQIQIYSRPLAGTQITVILPLLAAPRPVGVGIK